jgi:multidrug resistance efflux pump
MVKRVIKIAALIFGLLVLLLVGFLAWIIYTESGLRFAVARLPEHLGKVTLRIEGVSGTIAEVCLENQSPVEFGQVLFRVEPS